VAKKIPPPRPNAQKLPKNLDPRAKAMYTGNAKDIAAAKKAFPAEKMSLRDKFRLAVIQKQQGAPLTAYQEALIDAYCDSADLGLAQG
jgi:hypothetical protein